MSLPLTKFLAPTDYAELAEELKEVDPLFASASPQHPARRWEYAMALRAVREWWWEGGGHPKSLPPLAVDVGGAGSPLHEMLRARGLDVFVVDPTVNFPVEKMVGKVNASVVTCISTIEHVPHEAGFIHALAQILSPGGLLFLTTDAWDQEGEDITHFHWMRERIYNRNRLCALAAHLALLGVLPFGEVDLRYHGPQVYDYSFAAMTFRKED